MSRFVIFPYVIDGHVFVEAYPLDSRPWDAVLAQVPLLHVLVNVPSRNQAKRAAWCLWICASGKGFNRAISPSKERFNAYAQRYGPV